MRTFVDTHRDNRARITFHLDDDERLDPSLQTFSGPQGTFATINLGGRFRLFTDNCTYARLLSEAIESVNRAMDAAERRAALALVPEDAA